MVTVESECDRRDGVTFVTARVTNTRRTPQRVTLRSTLEGPVWPPRSGMLDAPAWSDRTWEGTIEPGRIRGIGFATSAEPPAVPGLDAVELVETERVETDDDPDPREVLASLENWTPPSDAFTESR